MNVPIHLPERTIQLAKELAEKHGCTPPQAIATAVDGWSNSVFGTNAPPIPREVEGLLYRAVVLGSEQDLRDPTLRDWLTANLGSYPRLP